MPGEAGLDLPAHASSPARGRALATVALLVLTAVAAWWWVVLFLDTSGDWAFDFRQFWQGGHDVTHGASPYPDDLPSTGGDELGPVEIQEAFRFPYPAFAALVLAPFGALQFQLAAALWALLLVAALVASVWILGVRDWLVLGIVATSVPVMSAVRLGTLTPLLVLLLAVCWRWRDRPWVAGGSLAVAVSLKLFLWPLAVWLAATRRFAAAAIAAGLAGAATLAAWAAIGFEGMSSYPELVGRLSDVVADRGFSLVALGTLLELSDGVSGVLPWLVGLPLLGLAVVCARGEDGDRRAFSLAVVASLALTPIVWLHYLALLVVPLALARARFAWAWALLWAAWLIPAQGNEGDLWRIVVAAALVGAVAVVTGRAPAPHSLYGSRSRRPKMGGVAVQEDPLAGDTRG